MKKKKIDFKLTKSEKQLIGAFILGTAASLIANITFEYLKNKYLYDRPY